MSPGTGTAQPPHYLSAEGMEEPCGSITQGTAKAVTGRQAESWGGRCGGSGVKSWGWEALGVKLPENQGQTPEQK